MRLSDVRGERTMDALADLVEPLANIAEDEGAMALFKREKLPEGETPRGFFAKRMRKAVPSLLRGHRDDLMAVMAALEGTTPAEYAKGLSMVKLLRDLYEMATDPELMAFLSSVVTLPESSGSASESTQGQGAQARSSAT